MRFRDTGYARELVSVAIGDVRIERLFVKSENQEENSSLLVARWSHG